MKYNFKLQIENLDLTQLTKPMILIQTFKHGGDNFLSLQQTLENLQPNYVIMYHSNVTAIRQIEVRNQKKNVL